MQQDKIRGVYLANAHEAAVSSEAQLVSVMQHGLSNRAVAATAMNAGSSRSHCIVMLMLHKEFPDGRQVTAVLCPMLLPVMSASAPALQPHELCASKAMYLLQAGGESGSQSALHFGCCDGAV